MTRFEPLYPTEEWVEVTTEPSDYERNAWLMPRLLFDMFVVRSFEEKLLEFAGEMLVHGPLHSSIGQEGGSAGAILALRPGDCVNGSHRGHHQFISKALGALLSEEFDPLNESVPEDVREMLSRTMAEIMGLRKGYGGGRGGSMHLRWQPFGNLGTNAIVGGGVPLAAGSAWAQHKAGDRSVTVAFFGDGAINIGSVLETMNLAALWRLPLCFFIENNQYAVATTVQEATHEPRLSSRGLAFGIPSLKVDGMDPIASYIAMNRALQIMRSGKGPVVIEADLYRYYHQSGPLPGSAFGYRSKEEEKQWQDRDPIARVKEIGISLGVFSMNGADEIESSVRTAISNIADEIIEVAENKRHINPSLWPDTEGLEEDIRGDLSEFANTKYEEVEDASQPLIERKFIDVIADTIGRRMEVDERVIHLGEDVHRLRGGTNGATRGLAERFPSRLLATPISEEAFAGLAGGIAMDGRFRPIVEFMYPDFVWVAADQIFNQIGKARHMYGGGLQLPLVLRTKVAIGTGYGSQHSMDPAGLFACSPGWRIVAPATPYDYVGLLNSALHCQDPVLVLEHVDLYPQSGPAPESNLDYFIELGKARIARSGESLTILSYLSMVEASISAADQLGIDAEVIDLRTLDRAGLDWTTISRSVKKTNNVLVIEQGSSGPSYGAWLADEVHRRLFDWLDQPVQRLTGGEASPTVSKVLERAASVGEEEIQVILRQTLSNIGNGDFIENRDV